MFTCMWIGTTSQTALLLYTSRAVRAALKTSDFTRLGERLALLGLPTVFVLEGGYAADELGTNAVNVLDGFEQAAVS